MTDMPRDNRRIMLFLVLSNFMLFFGFYIWQSSFNNFAVEQLGLGPTSIGWTQSLRELPGLFGFALSFLAVIMSEARLMAVSGLLLGAGIFLTGQTYSFPMLLISTFIMSSGFHFFYPCSNAVVLTTIEQQHAPRVLGQLNGLGSLAAGVAGLAVIFLTKPLGYRPLYMAAGILIILVAVILVPLGNPVRGCMPKRRKVVLRRRYWLYYTMSVLMGSRRHISSTFAIFLLVKDYHISVQTSATLFLAVNLINAYTLGLTGRLVGKLGERLAFSISYITLIAVFLGYAFVRSLPILFALFVLDNIVSGFTVALQTYFQKIAVSPDEITGNMTLEQTTNHITAVIVPVMGGVIWDTLGSQATFLVGTAIVGALLLLSQFVRTAKQPAPTLAPA